MPLAPTPPGYLFANIFAVYPAAGNVYAFFFGPFSIGLVSWSCSIRRFREPVNTDWIRYLSPP